MARSSKPLQQSARTLKRQAKEPVEAGPDPDLQIDHAVPRTDNGGQDPRALDAPLRPNGGHLFGTFSD
jgi:hypothetical protein